MCLAAALARGVAPHGWQAVRPSALPPAESWPAPGGRPQRQRAGAASRAAAAAPAWRASPVHPRRSRAMDEERTTNFNDPVYGDEGIKLPRQFLKVVDTPEFQRLRSIKQLGSATFVFHGATHTCFEHSLGVAHLAREAALTLRGQQNLAFDVTDSDVRVVTLAGLCSNLGRPPFLDALQKAGLERQPEMERERAAVLFQRICAREGDGMGISSDEKERVLAALRKTEDPARKTPLFDIVNGSAGVDVATMDYLVRDAIYCRMDTRVQFYPRLTSSLKVLPSETPGSPPQLCWSQRYQANIKEMFRRKERMQREVYMEPQVDAISNMIADILRLVGKRYSLQSKLQPSLAGSPDGFLTLDDTLLTSIDIYNGSDQDMLKAQDLLHRIYRGNVYQLVGERQVPRAIHSFPKRLQTDSVAGESSLKEGEDFIVSEVTIQWLQSHTGNPMRAIHWFFEGHGSTLCRLDTNIAMLPVHCFERKLRVYLKTADASATEKSKALNLLFRSYCEKHLKGPGQVRKPPRRNPDVFEVQDRIYGKVVLPAKYRQVVEHPYFYRMKGIAQLGACSYVYCGGSHTRFEHSVGVGYLAYKAVTNLQRDCSMKISEEDVVVVTLAGLCHDLGHGPFSHLFEAVAKKLLPEEDREGFTHERMSCLVFSRIMEDLRARDIDGGSPMLSKKVEGRVANVINGERAAEVKPYLVDIVSNTVNSIDVDKLDYLVRDAAYTNYMQQEHFEPLLESVRVVDGQLSWPAEAAPLIAEMYSQRANMHRQVYQHPRGKAIEIMLQELLEKAGRAWDMQSDLLDPDKYVRLRGELLNRVQHSNPEEIIKACHREAKPTPSEVDKASGKAQALSDAQALVQRIRRRDIYRFVAEVRVPESELDSKDITEQNVIGHLGKGTALTVDDIKVWNKKLDWPKSRDGPMSNVVFHELSDDGRPQRIDLAVQELMMVPSQPRERSVVLFLKKTDGSPELLTSRMEDLTVAFKKGILEWFPQAVAFTPNKESSSKKRPRSHSSSRQEDTDVAKRLQFSDSVSSAAP